jgi:uncharacterized protein
MRLAAAGYRPMAWKNGQGLTREIARAPASGADFLWRLSIAEIAVSGDFSPFAGYDRTITLIAGAGIVLEFAEARAQRIERCFEPFEFSGDWRCRCHLIRGPVRDFNLIVQRSRARANTEVLHLDGRPLERRVETGVLLVFCAEGRLVAGGFRAEAGDTIQLEAGCHRLEGQNALALVMAVHMLRGK